MFSSESSKGSWNLYTFFVIITSYRAYHIKIKKINKKMLYRPLKQQKKQLLSIGKHLQLIQKIMKTKIV